MQGDIKMHKALNFLTILALFFATVSPACAFVSGKSNLIEICTANGIEYIAVEGLEAPSENKQTHRQSSEKADCAFCFAQMHIDALYTQESTASHIVTTLNAQGTPSDHLIIRTTHPYTARAPPATPLS